MFADRGVARFLVAPRGYGKTMLALEYVEMASDFQDTFWINCQSPCFLRDLDKGIIASTLLDLAPKGSIVVFDDLPYLGDGRAEAFSSDIDAFLLKGWEVVVSVPPMADCLSELQKDRVAVVSSDFLLTDAELEAAGMTTVEVAPCERLASFVWGRTDGVDDLFVEMKSAFVPAEVSLAVFSMLVLTKGTFEDLSLFCRGLKKDTRRFLSEWYPHLGIDLVEERFELRDVSIARLERICRAFIDSALERTGSISRDTFVERLAGVLMGKEHHARACALVGAFCTRNHREAWLEHNQRACMDRGALEAVQELFRALGTRWSAMSASLVVGAAVRLYMLGAFKRASSMALRAMDRSDASDMQCCIAAAVAEAVSDGEARVRARSVLERLAKGDAVTDPSAAFATMRLLQSEDLAASVRILERFESLPSFDEGFFLLEVARLVRLSKDAARCADASSAAASAYSRALDYAAGRLALCRAKGHPTIYEALLCEAAGVRAWNGEEDAQRRRDVESMLFSLAEQKAGFKQEQAASERSSMRIVTSSHKGVEPIPPMYIRLFGGMEVRIGSDVIEPDAFRKQKAKILLAILALHRGKEVPRHEILDILWPGSAPERANSGLYSLWSLLKRAVSAPNGQCPYLVKQQKSCMLDARYVKSDVDEFEEICRTLAFGEPDGRKWMEAFSRFEDDFSCGLLPAETSNEYIVRLRERYRTRLTDAYVTAADRLCDAGEARAALWFAQAAADRFGPREDIFYVLMRAQTLTGQRNLAMDTFFACRRFMVEELGMDPSERIVRLHGELLAEAAHGGSLVSA